MVRRGLVESRELAHDAIAAGRVLVGGAPADKPSRLIDPGDALSLAGDPPRFVGRGGEKLAAALDAFAIDVSGLRCLDAGASTGGFTDCLLQRGAASVVAVDVGHGQLHPKLRSDGRVDVRERVNIRHAKAADVDGPFPLVVADLSFISLRTVAAALAELTAPGGDLVALVKPQFEVGRAEASRGRGVVRDPIKRDEAVDVVVVALERAGAAMMGRMVSPLRGADGNVEVFVHVRRCGGRCAPGRGGQ